jgi:hypothetical protein
MKSGLRNNHKGFSEEMWKIDKTNGVLSELEKKMYSHFEKKPSEDHLLNSLD